MSVTTAVTGQNVHNNGATIFGAGNFVSGNITNSLTQLVNNAEPDTGNYGPRQAVSPGSSGNLGTFHPLVGGTFGYNPSVNRTWIMNANNVTTSISGSGTSSFLMSGAAVGKQDRRQNPAFNLDNRLMDIKNWNYPSGQVEYGGNQGTVSHYQDGLGATCRLDWAAGSGNIPGKFSAMTGSKIPVTFEYKPRYNP